MKHAPAPWTAHFTGDALWEIYADGSEIKHADVFGCNQEMDEANAHLIAAAPDLLEALKFARDLLRSSILWTDYVDERISPAMAQAAPPTDEPDSTLEKE